ncbi:MAG: NAD(P)/FAD-dependent oxidoreductase [Gemmatimonadales bacterium]
MLAARPRIVIVGGGFGGLAAAKALKRINADVTLIDRTNYHLFQPMLYQVATASLAPSDITAPIRYVLRKQKNVTVLLAEVTAIDVEKKTVHIDVPSEDIVYDFLIVASGTRHSYFGHADWEQFAPGLKGIEDASEVRRRFLLAFENAEKALDPAERDAYLTFVVVGGGPTGVELSGALPPIATKALYPDFRNIDTRKTRVILVEGGSRILPSFPPDLSEVAVKSLNEIGVEVRTNSIVTLIDADSVDIGTEHIPTRTVFWAAGNEASPLGRMLGGPTDRSGKVLVLEDLSIPGHAEVFVVGDLAHVIRKDGRPVPGVCPAAIQEGRAAGKNIIHILRRQPTRPFHYFNKGDLAVIGRSRAIADFGKIQLSGLLAWLLWLFVHIMYLVGFRNRVIVFIEWAYNYFTYQRGVRVITNAEREGPSVPVR